MSFGTSYYFCGKNIYHKIILYSNGCLTKNKNLKKYNIYDYIEQFTKI